MTDQLVKDAGPVVPSGWATLQRASELIRQACRDQRTVTIWGHDDLDGIASTAIMLDALSGKTKVNYFIPPKNGVHYGLDTKVIDRLVSEGTGLIVTVDGGISNYDEAGHCRKKGIPLIITDHHELPSRLPPAMEVVNPKIQEPGSPYPNLCGAAVAFYLAAALDGSSGAGWHLKAPRRLAWAALATVSDRVPLLDDNRAIIKAGLEAISRDPLLVRLASLIDFDLTRGLSPGILQNGLIPLFATSQSLGSFHPMVDLLSGNIDEPMIRNLQEGQLQWRRRFDKELRQRLSTLDPDQAGIIVLADQDLPGDMIGPLAGGLRDSFLLPAVVIGKKGDAWVGEARGFLPFDLVEMLSGLKGYFTQYGGHKQAAGFTLKTGVLDEAVSGLASYSASHQDLILSSRPEIRHDYIFGDLRQLSGSIPGIIEKGPYGAGNPRPSCLIREARLPDVFQPDQPLWLEDLLRLQDAKAPVSTGITAVLDTTSTGLVSLSINPPQSIK